jgi:hypothetical protein
VTAQVITVAEDALSNVLLSKLINAAPVDVRVNRAIIAGGFGEIRRSIQKYRNACRVIPHLVITDLDRAECASVLLESWGAVNLPNELLFRVVEHEIESWVLADDAGISAYLGVGIGRVPARPDDLLDPKEALVALARHGSQRRICAGIIPGGPQRIGALYNQRLIEFVTTIWDLNRARMRSPNLERTATRVVAFLSALDVRQR